MGVGIKCDDLSSVSHIHIYLRASTIKKALNHQMEWVAQVISSLCQWPSQHWHNAYMHKGAVIAGIEAMHKPSNVNTSIKNWLAVPAKGPSCQKKRPVFSSQYDTMPKRDHMVTYWEVDYIGQDCVLAGGDTSSDGGFSFCQWASASITPPELTKCFMYQHRIPHHRASDQGPTP